MACEVPQTIQNFPMPAAADYRCLYVGKGPSMAKVGYDHLGWGDLATVNDAAASPLLADKFNQVAFCDGPKFYSSIPPDRTGLIVAPHTVLKKDIEGIKPIVVCWTKRAALQRSSIIDAIIKRESAYFGAPGPSGVVTLWLMGYRKIWLFGHDGGRGVAGGFEDTSTDYGNRREAIEFMVPLLRERGCDVKFWPETF